MIHEWMRNVTKLMEHHTITDQGLILSQCFGYLLLHNKPHQNIVT